MDDVGTTLPNTGMLLLLSVLLLVLVLAVSFRTGLRLSLLGLGLMGPDWGLLLLLAVLLHKLVTVTGTAVRAKWGLRRVRVQRGSLGLRFARWTLCLGCPGMSLKGVKNGLDYQVDVTLAGLDTLQGSGSLEKSMFEAFWMDEMG
jgi:hypothetical protein